MVHSVLTARGEELPPQLREDMGRRLGGDFSAVRVHTGERAAASAAAVSARAYAVGSHVVLGPGARLDDRELLAHELTHVARAGRATLSVPADLQIAAADDHEERAASRGFAQAVSPARSMLYRQQATDRDRKDYVEATISFLRSSASYYTDPAVSVDQALVSRVLDSWYRTVTAQEGIASGLRAGPALSEALKAAYTAAVAALLGRAAAVTRVPLPELYRLNRGRIPPWAWQEPQHVLPGIATPVPAGREADLMTGAVSVAAPGISVSILPDAPNPGLKSRAETRISLTWPIPGYQWAAKGPDHIVTAVDPVPAATATIQTFYGPGIAPASRSGYGRGTTPEDVTGAAVDPRGGTVAFHEGQHGMDYIEFLRTHKPPVFGGHPGMTVPQFTQAALQWNQAWHAYEHQARVFTQTRTDCVGVTIDQWEQQRAAGKRVKLICPR
jgi:Domain of unknown function (DUF4157)